MESHIIGCVLLRCRILKIKMRKGLRLRYLLPSNHRIVVVVDCGALWYFVQIVHLSFHLHIRVEFHRMMRVSLTGTLGVVIFFNSED
jgi:hypothetical protein